MREGIEREKEIEWEIEIEGERGRENPLYRREEDRSEKDNLCEKER